MGGTLWTIGTVVGILSSVSSASSQVNIEKLRREEDQRGLSGTVDVDVSGRSGNVDVWQVAVGGRVDFAGPSVTTLFVTRADFGWEDGKRFSNEALLHLRRVHRNRSWLRPEAFVQINYDKPRLLTFRGLLGAGLRIGIASSENFAFWWGSAYMVEHESLELPEGARHSKRVWVHRWSNYLSSRAVLSERATLLWSVYLQPRINVFEDVRAIAELDIGVDIDKPIFFRGELPHPVRQSAAGRHRVDRHIVFNGNFRRILEKGRRTASMVEEKIYRAGAIGRTGGGNYGHGIHLGYKGHERIEFVSVADPDEEGRQRAEAETGAKRTYADYQEMLERESLDLVSVCPRWVDCHLEMVLACVEAGCHVYCEKPMAMRLDDADRMVSAADRRGVRIAVAHQGVYLPQTQEAKRLVKSGRIGTPHTIYAWGKQDHRGGGEDTMVLGTHLFNTMRFFFSEVAWMFAHVTVEGREIGPGDVRDGNEPIGPVAGDCVESYFSFQSGVSGFFRSRANSHPGDRPYGMEIAGQEGRLALWGGSPDQIFLYPYGGSAPERPDRVWQRLDVETAPYTGGNSRAIQDLIQSIEEDRDPLSSGRDATSALEMILGAYESQISGGRVEFPMSERTHPLDRLRCN